MIGAIGLIGVLQLGCAKAAIQGRSTELPAQVRTFAADANRTYYAVRWALDAAEYPVATEELAAGRLATTWVATTADSHYIETFGRKDFGVNGAYYKLTIQLTPDGERTRVEITPTVKSVVGHLQSSGREEKRIFKKVGDYLHANEIELTNLGVTEPPQP